jgi:hypothetical protein
MFGDVRGGSDRCISAAASPRRPTSDGKRQRFSGSPLRLAGPVPRPIYTRDQWLAPRGLSYDQASASWSAVRKVRFDFSQLGNTVCCPTTWPSDVGSWDNSGNHCVVRPPRTSTRVESPPGLRSESTDPTGPNACSWTFRATTSPIRSEYEHRPSNRKWCRRDSAVAGRASRVGHRLVHRGTHSDAHTG